MLLIFSTWVPVEVMGQTGNASARPSSVNVGALFTFDSVIGQAARPAIAAAVDDVNSDSTVLPGTKLNLIFHDTNCSGFIGTIKGNQTMFSIDFELLEFDGLFSIGGLCKGCCPFVCEKHVSEGSSLPPHLRSYLIQTVDF